MTRGHYSKTAKEVFLLGSWVLMLGGTFLYYGINLLFR